MARLFTTSINLNKNELQNARIQNLSANPSNGVAGQIYFNNIANELRTYDGTQWVGAGSIQYGLAADRPAASKGGLLYATTDTKVMYLDNGTSWLQVGIGADTVDVLTNKTLDNPSLKNTVEFTNNSDTTYLEIYQSGTGTARLVSDDDISIRSNNGDVILYPGNDNGGTGKAYVHWGNDATGANPQNEITTAGNTQTFTNKTIGDQLTFNDGSNDSAIDVDGNNLYVNANDNLTLSTATGNIILNPSGDSYLGSVSANNKIATIGDLNSDQVIQSVTGTANQINVSNTAGDVTLSLPSSIDINRASDSATSIVLDADAAKITLRDPSADVTVIDIYGSDSNAMLSSTYSLNLSSGSGDITLTPEGKVTIDSDVDISGEAIVSTVKGKSNVDNGSIAIKNSDASSEIHIDGTTKNIELLPASGSKAFYGSAATAGNEIAKISDLQSLSSGLNWKQAVNLLWDDSNAPLTGNTLELIIDGHPALGQEHSGYRILITAGANRGIWDYQDNGTTWTLTRSADADANAELIGAAVFVMEGTIYGSTSWVQNNHYINNFDNQDWVQFSGQGTYIGSDSISIDGRAINVVADNSRGLAIDGDGLYTKIGNGIEFDGSGNVAINAGTGFDISSGTLEFASSYGTRKFTDTIGNNSSTSFTLNHGFGTRYVTVQVFQSGTPYAQIETDVEHTDSNNVTIKFSSAPGIGEYEVVIVG